MKYLLISNPVAGKNSKKKTKRIASYLSSFGAEVSIETTLYKGNATNLAAQAYSRKVDAVIVLSGDGTISEAINGMAGIDVPIGIIPVGTANVFAGELGISENIYKAADVILRGKEKRISLGVINGTYFMLMASCGFDAEVVSSINLKLKSKIGKLAYIASAAAVLRRYNFPEVNVCIDQRRECKGCLVVISNARYYAGKFVMAPHASTDDKFLDVCIFTKRGRGQMLRYLWGLFTKRHHKYKDVVYVKARHVRMSSAEKVNVQVDGDPFCRLPADVSVVPKILRVFCP